MITLPNVLRAQEWPTEPKLTLKPLVGKQQQSYHMADMRGNFFEGAVRSSKTVVSILKWAEFMKTAPTDGGLAMIGRTERTLKRNVLDVMQMIYGPKVFKIIQGSGEARFFGRRIYLVGANDETAVSKIQGMTLAGWYGDEMPTWPQAVYDIARTRLSVAGARWYGTGNPASPHHHLKRDVIDRAALHIARDGEVIRRFGDDAVDVAVFSYVLKDNPFLPADFVRSLEREYTGVFYRRFILGEWCMAEGAIYDQWDEKRHIVDDAGMPPISPDNWISIGIDYGTSNPFHALTLGHAVDPADGVGRLWVPHEYRYDGRKAARQKTDAEYVAEVLAWKALANVDPRYVCVDPSAASFRTALYQAGLPSVAANNHVADGIRTVASLIAGDRLRVHRRCAGLIREIPGYAWDDRAAKLGNDEPVKADDHGLDALRYEIKTTETLWRDSIYGGMS